MSNKLSSASIGVMKPVNVTTANYAGAAVDIKDFVDEFLITHNIVHSSGAGVTCVAKIQESDDGSTGWTDITGAEFTSVGDGSEASYEDVQIDANAAKRYIRYTITLAGTSPIYFAGAGYIGKKQVR